MTSNKLIVPRHVAIILDGNRRWARANNLPTLEGHRRGYSNLKKIALEAFKNGVEILTVFAFSTENWNRDKKEVEYLLRLFKLLVNREVNFLIKKGVRVNFWGRRKDFDRGLQADMKRVETITRNNRHGVLNICLSYGGRDEIVRAVKKIIIAGTPVAQISEKLIAANLDSAGWPDPDLIIRTSGEERLSGFLTWQSVYSEFYFPKKYWPEFDSTDLKIALRIYGQRKRRYGR